MITHPQVVAGGDIRPSRFIKTSTVANHTVLEADANERTFGISGEDTLNAPETGSSSLHASTAYPRVKYYMPGEECLLEIGSGGCTAGDLLTPDADGKGVANTTDKRWYGARALTTAAAGEFAMVQVEHGFNAV